MIVSDEIERLHALHQAGALTDAEFAQAKARLLNGVTLDKTPPFAAAPPVREQHGHDGHDLAQELNRLRRAQADRWLGGVCGGLGAVSGMESWIWRLVFAAFTVTFGFGLVIYLLLWIFVPNEEIRNQT